MKSEVEQLMSLIKKYLVVTKGKSVIQSYKSPIKKIKTKVISESEKMDEPIRRSTYDTEIIKTDKKDIEMFSAISEALTIPDDYWREYKKDLYDLKNEIQNIKGKMSSKLKSNKTVNSILYDTIGYKTHNIDECLEQISKFEYSEIFYNKFIHDQIISYLVKMKVDNLESLLSIDNDDWSTFYMNQLKSIRMKQKYKYRVTFYINSPYCPSTIASDIGYIYFDDFKLKLFASYVTDEELDKLEDDFMDKSILNYINSKIYYEVSIPIENEVHDFEKLYLDAIKVGKKILLNLRLSYEFEIGIYSIKVVPQDNYTPDIRNRFNFEYNSKYTAFFPKRQIFYSNTEFNLFSNEPLKLFKKLNRINYSVKWLEIAIKRYNIAIDNYNNKNIERLLDISIGFEAIYLNDNESNKELSNRLSLRAAKFLGRTVKTRKKIYKIIKDLYKYRSKIAHGENIESFKKKDKDRIEEINTLTLILLKDSIIKMYNLSSKKILWQEYWENLILK